MSKMRYLSIAAVLLALTLSVSAESTDYMAFQWNYSAKEVLSGIDVADLNADGGREILAAGSSDGFVYALSNRGQELWKAPCNAIINVIRAADLDNSGGSEVIAGHSDLYIFDRSGQRVGSFNSDNPVYDVTTGRLNGNGNLDILYLSYDQQSCTKDGEIDAIEYPPKRLWKYSVKMGQPTSMFVDDVNKDGLNEVILGTAYRTRDTQTHSCLIQRNHGASVQLLSGSGGLIWSYTTESWVTKVLSADIDGDGNVEIIAASSPTLYVLNRDGTLKWRYDPPGSDILDERTRNDIADVVVADLFGDGKREIVFGSNKVYALGSNGSLLWTKATVSRVYSLATGSISGNVHPEIVVGAESVYVLDKAGSELWKSPRLTTVSYVKVSDIDGDGYDEVVAGAIKTVIVYKTQLYAKILSARALYEQALAYKSQNNVELALSSANEAKRLYSEAGKQNEVLQCVSLIDDLNNLSSRYTSLQQEADYNLNLSRQAYINGDYYNASKYAQIARSKYASPQINSRVLVEECDRMIQNSNYVLKLNATEYYAEALSRYAAGKYGEALPYATQSQELFLMIGDTDGSAKTGALIANITKITGSLKQPEKPLNITIIPWVAEKVSGIKPVWVLVTLLVFIALVAVLSTLVYVVKNSRRPKLRTEHLGKIEYRKTYHAPVNSKVVRKKGKGVGLVLFRCVKK